MISVNRSVCGVFDDFISKALPVNHLLSLSTTSSKQTVLLVGMTHTHTLPLTVRT